MRIRGTLTVGFLGTALVIGDLIQRTLISGAVRVLPSKRNRILAMWQRGLAHLVLGATRRIGGARVSPTARIPGRPGVLVLMNHQSLLDIPLVVRAVDGVYPRIVTRARYARGKPLISHMTRLYQYPLVQPGATVKKHLASLGRAAAEAPGPVVLYPEGTRTRTGDIGRFKKLGLRSILGARSWEVWVMVSDGHWQAGRLADFLDNASSIDLRATVRGPYPSPEPAEGTDRIDAFVDRMDEEMRSALSELRADPHA